MSQSDHIAIIGAGISGLALALALHQQSIPCALYEGREAPLNTGGSLLIAPNGLKALKGIGAYDDIVEEAFAYDKAFMMNGETGKILETIEFGNVDRYGEHALRVYRYTVIEKLLENVRKAGIPIRFNRRFSHVISETETSVTWQFTDGSSETASLLVGADGINSAVRRYIAPEVKPEYRGIVTLIAVVPTSQLQLPAEDLRNQTSASNKWPMPCGITAPGLGAFLISPQKHDGSEQLITVMRPFPEAPVDGKWSILEHDKEKLRAMFRENVEQFPEVVQNAVSDLPDAGLHVWANHILPHPIPWTSIQTAGGHGRVAILGDAAHAIPPSAGQGANMAFEDACLYALALRRVGGDLSQNQSLRNAIKGWEAFRKTRLDWVLKLNKQMEMRRLPTAALAELGYDLDELRAESVETQDAVFMIDYKKAVEACIGQEKDA